MKEKKINFKSHDEFYDFFIETDGEFDEIVTFKHDDIVYLFNEENYDYSLKEYGKAVRECVAENNIEQMLSNGIIDIHHE